MMTLFDISKHTVQNEAAKFATDFQTPLNVCRYMVSLMPNDGKMKVLEPTPGIGNLICAITERFLSVNLIAPEDFFLLPKR